MDPLLLLAMGNIRDCGNILDRGNILETMGIFWRQWEYFRDRGNNYLEEAKTIGCPHPPPTFFMILTAIYIHLLKIQKYT